MKSIIIGVTGQSGVGKSTVCEMFEKFGYKTINADLVARQVVLPSSNCLNELTKQFSTSILNDDKSLNRKILGSIVFNDKDKLDKLNNIIFPYIISEIQNQINELTLKNKYILLDAPTLFESKANELCDFTIGIVTDLDISINRIIKRDNISLIDAKARIDSQFNKDFFINNCDFVIENIGSLFELEKKVENIINIINEKTGD